MTELLSDLHKLANLRLSRDVASVSTVEGTAFSDSVDAVVEYASRSGRTHEALAQQLVGGDESLLEFVLKMAGVKDAAVVGAKARALSFVCKVWGALRWILRPAEVTRLQQSCWAIFRRDAAATVRHKALELLEKSLDAAAPANSGEIMQTLLGAVQQRSAQSVRAAELSLLAALLEGLHATPPWLESLTGMVLARLDQQFSAARPEMMVMAGYIRCLHGILSVRGRAAFDVAGEDAKRSVYCAVFVLGLQQPEGMTRYDVPRACLRFAAAHAHSWKEYLAQDAMPALKRLGLWSCHTNRYVRGAALRAVVSVLREVALELSSGARTAAASFETYSELVRDLVPRIDPARSLDDIALGVSGVAAIIPAVVRYSSVAEAARLLDRVLSAADVLLGTTLDRQEFTLGTVHIFIHCAAAIVNHLPLAFVSDALADRIANLVAVATHVWPLLYRGTQSDRVSDAFAHLSVALYSRGLPGRAALQRVLWDIFSWAVAALPPAVLSDTPPPESPLETPHRLMVAVLMPSLDFVEREVLPDVSDADVPRIRDFLADELMLMFVRLLSMLDLAYDTVMITSPEDTVRTDVVPHCVDDQDMLLRLVGLLNWLWPRMRPALFVRWLDPLCDRLLSKLSHFPMVSGFYRLLARLLSVVRSHSLWKHHPILSTVAQRLQSFAYTLIPQLVSFQYELMASTIEFLLAVPIKMNVVDDDEDCGELMLDPLERALSFGRRYPTMCHVALDALEDLLPKLSSTELYRVADRLLPSLEPFITPSTLNHCEKKEEEEEDEDEDEEDEEEEENNDVYSGGSGKRMRLDDEVPHFSLSEFRKTDAGRSDRGDEEKLQLWTAGGMKKRRVKRTAIPASAKSLASNIFEQRAQAPGDAVHARVLRIMGRMGGAVSDVLAREGGVQLDGYSSHKPAQLGAALPLLNRHAIMLHMESVVPRALELAESAGSRATKLAACELLHAAVQFCIGVLGGQSPQMAQTSRTSGGVAAEAAGELVERAFPALVRLAVDVEPVVADLFGQLVGQLVRYVSLPGSSQRSSIRRHLLAHVGEALTDERGGPLRSYAARLLTEFLRDAGDDSDDDVFRLLRARAAEPSPPSRLGALEAYAAILDVSRESGFRAVVERHLIELCAALVRCMRASTADATASVAVSMVQTSLQHCVRLMADVPGLSAAALDDAASFRVAFTSLHHLLNWSLSTALECTPAGATAIRDFVTALAPMAAEPIDLPLIPSSANPKVIAAAIDTLRWAVQSLNRSILSTADDNVWSRSFEVVEEAPVVFVRLARFVVEADKDAAVSVLRTILGADSRRAAVMARLACEAVLPADQMSHVAAEASSVAAQLLHVAVGGGLSAFCEAAQGLARRVAAACGAVCDVAKLRGTVRAAQALVSLRSCGVSVDVDVLAISLQLLRCVDLRTPSAADMLRRTFSAFLSASPTPGPLLQAVVSSASTSAEREALHTSSLRDPFIFAIKASPSESSTILASCIDNDDPFGLELSFLFLDDDDKESRGDDKESRGDDDAVMNIAVAVGESVRRKVDGGKVSDDVRSGLFRLVKAVAARTGRIGGLGEKHSRVVGESAVAFFGRRVPLGMRVHGLQLLSTVLAPGVLVAEDADRVCTAALDSLVDMFPPRAADLDARTLLATEFDEAVAELGRAARAAPGERTLRLCLPYMGAAAGYRTPAAGMADAAALLSPEDAVARVVDPALDVVLGGVWPGDVRQAVVQQVIAPVLKAADEPRLLALIAVHLRRVLDAAMQASAPADSAGLTKRACALEILAHVLAGVTAESLRGQLNDAPKPQALIQTIIQVCLTSRRDALAALAAGTSASAIDAARRCVRHSYVALSTIILKTQSPSKFEKLYAAWLFPPTSEVMLWPSLVDPNSIPSMWPSKLLQRRKSSYPMTQEVEEEEEKDEEQEKQKKKKEEEEDESVTEDVMVNAMANLLEAWKKHALGGADVPGWLRNMLEFVGGGYSEPARYLVVEALLSGADAVAEYAVDILAALSPLMCDGESAWRQRFVYAVCRATSGPWRERLRRGGRRVAEVVTSVGVQAARVMAHGGEFFGANMYAVAEVFFELRGLVGVVPELAALLTDDVSSKQRQVALAAVRGLAGGGHPFSGPPRQDGEVRVLATAVCRWLGSGDRKEAALARSALAALQAHDLGGVVGARDTVAGVVVAAGERLLGKGGAGLADGFAALGMVARAGRLTESAAAVADDRALNMLVAGSAVLAEADVEAALGYLVWRTRDLADLPRHLGGVSNSLLRRARAATLTLRLYEQALAHHGGAAVSVVVATVDASLHMLPPAARRALADLAARLYAVGEAVDVDLCAKARRWAHALLAACDAREQARILTRWRRRRAHLFPNDPAEWLRTALEDLAASGNPPGPRWLETAAASILALGDGVAMRKPYFGELVANVSYQDWTPSATVSTSDQLLPLLSSARMTVQSQQTLQSPSSMVLATVEEEEDGTLVGSKVKSRFKVPRVSVKKKAVGEVRAESVRSRVIRSLRRQEDERVRRRAGMRREQLYAVELSRKYRLGSMPDVQICPADLASPLQAVCLRDSSAAHEVLRMLFGSLDNPGGLREAAARCLEASATVPVVARFLLELVDEGASATMIGHVARESRSYAEGVRALERILEDDNEAARKWAVAAWVQVGQLSDELGDRDMQLGLYRGRRDEFTEFSARGAAAEMENRLVEAFLVFEQALRVYDEDGVDGFARLAVDGSAAAALVRAGHGPVDGAALRRVPSEAEVSFWEDRRLACLRRLGKWEAVADLALERGDGDVARLLEVAPDDAVEQFVAAVARMGAASPYANEVAALAGRGLPPRRRDELAARFGGHLALLEVQRGADHCVYLAAFYRQAAEQWARLPPAAAAARLRLFADVQAAVQVDEAASPTRHVLRRWRTVFPSPIADDTATWDRVVGVRTVLALHLPRPSNADEAWDLAVEDTRLEAVLALIAAARARGNFALTDRLASDMVKNLRPRSIDARVRVRCELLRLHVAKVAAAGSSDPSVRFDRILRGLEFIASRENRERVLLDSAKEDYQKDWLDMKISLAISFQKEVSSVDRSVDVELPLHVDQPNWIFEQLQNANKHLELALFCDEMLNKSEESVYVRAFCRGILRGMKQGDRRAQYRLPRVLRWMRECEDARVVWDEVVTEVPVWMFLKWYAQLRALADGSAGSQVAAVLRAVEMAYPGAGLDLGGVRRSAAQERFVQGLSDLSHPDVRLKDWVAQILAASKKSGGAADVTRLWEAMIDDVASARRDLGTLNASHARLISKSLCSHFGVGTPRTSLDETSAALKRFPIARAARAEEKFQKVLAECKIDAKGGEMQVAHFSRILGSMQVGKIGEAEIGECELEIPGQYDGRRRPDPEHHVRLKGVEATLLMLRSMRRPKRLTLVGSDERSYRFLVKGGEDLRQDQRVVEVFTVMNEMLRSAGCSDTQPTYLVLPLTDRVGLIEWVQDTTTFRALAEAQVDSGSELFRFGARRQQWLESFGSGNAAYLKMLEAGGQGAAMDVYRATVRAVPPVMRMALERLAGSSPATFVRLRGVFARSLAVTSIAGYILGIGDRHLDNLLMDNRRGTVVPIDFGHAFGSATQNLAVPELIPFRLTPTISQALGPQGCHIGAFRETCRRVLSAFRTNRHDLLSVLDIFTLVPLADWHTLADRLPSQAYPSRTTDRRSEFVRQKLLCVSHKLDGYSPINILKLEILHSIHHSRYSSIEKIISTTTNDLKSASKGDLGDILNPDQQTDLLLNLATNPNILIRTYLGWLPWI